MVTLTPEDFVDMAKTIGEESRVVDLREFGHDMLLVVSTAPSNREVETAIAELSPDAVMLPPRGNEIDPPKE